MIMFYTLNQFFDLNLICKLSLGVDAEGVGSRICCKDENQISNNGDRNDEQLHHRATIVTRS